MPIVITFCAIVLAVCGYAILRGGEPERAMGGMLLAATAAGLLLEHPEGLDFVDVAVATLMVDATLFAAMVALALKANRYWPIWTAALHATTLATHLVKILNPTLLPNVYHVAAAISSFPILLILAIATSRHRARVKRLGTDPSWSDFFDRLTQAPQMAGQRR